MPPRIAGPAARAYHPAHEHREQSTAWPARPPDTAIRDFALYLRRSFAKSMGYSQAMLDRPVVGIVDTGSDYNNCHRTVPELVEAVKRGVLAAGGLPLAFPTVSLCEPSLFPTARCTIATSPRWTPRRCCSPQPMDAAVLIGGCDKTVPAQLMAAASADIPCVQLVTGPMLATPFQGERLSACTDCRRYWAAYRAGRVTAGADRRDRGPARHHRRHLRRDGHRLHHGVPGRGAGHGAAGSRLDPRGARRPAARRRGCRRPGGAADRPSRSGRPRSSPRNRWRTRCACCWRWAAPPTR